MSETAAPIAHVWEKEQLMGEKDVDGITFEEDFKSKDGKVLPQYWGVPGYLSEEEYECYAKFKEEVEKRGGDFRKTVYSFGEEEGECYTLTRWCRARKFVIEDVLLMVEQAVDCCAEARKNEFYPDAKEALGCDMALYFEQFPQLYTGYGKNKCPLFISKPGILNVDAVECITTLEGIIKFHWYIMMVDFGNRLREMKKNDADFRHFSCICVLDLAHLTTSQLGSRALAIIKEQAAIDSLCFPETMNKMLIINCPRFFAASWVLIKGWLDPRTAAKIDVISSRKAWEKKLLEYVDEDQLPVDYGGKGPDTKKTLTETQPPGMIRLHTEVMYVRGHGSVTFEVNEGEFLDIDVWTRSTTGAKFTVVDQDKKDAPLISEFLVKHGGSADNKENPTGVTISEKRLQGPLKIKIKADSLGSRFSSNNFMVAFKVYETTD